MIKGLDWRRRLRDRKKIKEEEKENEFYTNREINGTINQNNPKQLSIDEIKDNLDKADANVNALKNKQFSMMADGASDAEVFKAKRDVRIAEREVAGLSNLLTEAYGLGPNGYWNENNQTDNQNNSGQGAVQPTNISQVNNAQPRKVDQLNAWVNNPEGYRPPDALRPKATTPDTTMPDETVPTMGTPNTNTTQPTTNEVSGPPRKADQWNNWVNNPKEFRPPSAIRPQETALDTTALDMDTTTSKSGGGQSAESSEWIPSSMKTGISGSATDGHKYTILDNDEQQQGRAGEERYDEETQELCANIEQYLLAQANPDKDIVDFRGKYPYGSQQMKMWTDQLKVKMGEDAANMFISRCMKEAQAQYGGTSEETVGMKDPMDEHKYAQGTGGVEGNYKPLELIEAENAVALYEELFKSVALETKVNQDDYILIQDNIQLMKGTKDPFYIEVFDLLDEIQEETGCYTYQEALDNLDREQKNFEEYKEIEETKAMIARVEDELDENPEFTLFNWDENSSLDMDLRMQGYQDERDTLSITIEGKYKDLAGLEGDEREELLDEIAVYENRLNLLDMLLADNEVVLSDIDIEDMSLSQLTIKTEYDLMNLIKAFENSAIINSQEWFNDAIEDWKKGDDTAIRGIVLTVYGSTKDLEDIEDFNELLSDYVQFNWEASEDVIAERIENYYYDEIEPYFMEKANYQKMENGYTLELSPNTIEYVIEYARRQEEAKQKLGTTITAGGLGLGAIIGLFSGPVGWFIGLAVAGGAAITGSLVSNAEDIWDDVILKLDDYVGTDETIILVVNEKDDDADAIPKEEYYSD